MCTAGPASSRPELQTFHAKGGANTDMLGAALCLAFKEAGLTAVLELADADAIIYATASATMPTS